MSIVKATKAYERWAEKRIELNPHHLKLKHAAMAGAAFPFLRATFYRWVGLWREACPELAAAPKLLAVGDLHVENFGTWRDAEGRLAWGINDFDEAFPMPYTIDLVRLAASALLAIRERRLAISADEACDAVLAGYRAAIRRDQPRGFVLEEDHPVLRAMAMGAERDPERFWARIATLRRADAPKSARKLLLRDLSECGDTIRIVGRVAGLGSLGRPRFVGYGEIGGGLVAREAKAMLPSAYGWAMKIPDRRLYLETIVRRAVRAQDPHYRAEKVWLLRRLGPHCSRIPLEHFPRKRDESHILHAMGRETANVHAGSPAALPAVQRDLARRGSRWLRDAARRMADATLADWRDWRRHISG